MEWIRVQDRLPDIKDKSRALSCSEDVLVLDYDGIQYVGYLIFYGISGKRKQEQYSWSDRADGLGGGSESLKPTHWMPLPPYPKNYVHWISVEDRYPENKQFVNIKIWDDLNNCECEIQCIFNDYEDYRAWTISKEEHEGRKLVAKPTHWMPLPQPPKE